MNIHLLLKYTLNVFLINYFDFLFMCVRFIIFISFALSALIHFCYAVNDLSTHSEHTFIDHPALKNMCVETECLILRLIEEKDVDEKSVERFSELYQTDPMQKNDDADSKFPTVNEFFNMFQRPQSIILGIFGRYDNFLHGLLRLDISREFKDSLKLCGYLCPKSREKSYASEAQTALFKYVKKTVFESTDLNIAFIHVSIDRHNIEPQNTVIRTGMIPYDGQTGEQGPELINGINESNLIHYYISVQDRLTKRTEYLY